MTPAWIVCAWPPLLWQASRAPQLHLTHLGTRVLNFGGQTPGPCTGQTLWGDETEAQSAGGRMGLGEAAARCRCDVRPTRPGDQPEAARRPGRGADQRRSCGSPAPARACPSLAKRGSAGIASSLRLNPRRSAQLSRIGADRSAGSPASSVANITKPLQRMLSAAAQHG